ncbi:hypothetical protein KSP40_PGU020558 [Platanthera guangdongensis]|uniref:Uncharacterized protein n=1 Tax=Platanthera guangdongensis TaxID=2320717 RepID=A0ABR2MGY1_9ASPA
MLTSTNKEVADVEDGEVSPGDHPGRRDGVPMLTTNEGGTPSELIAAFGMNRQRSLHFEGFVWGIKSLDSYLPGKRKRRYLLAKLGFQGPLLAISSSFFLAGYLVILFFGCMHLELHTYCTNLTISVDFVVGVLLASTDTTVIGALLMVNDPIIIDLLGIKVRFAYVSPLWWDPSPDPRCTGMLCALGYPFSLFLPLSPVIGSPRNVLWACLVEIEGGRGYKGQALEWWRRREVRSLGKRKSEP